MSPKKKLKVGPQPEAAAVPPAAAAAAATTTTTTTANDSYLKEITAAVNVINSKWPDLCNCEPLEVEDGGFMMPFNLDTFELAIKKDGNALQYFCAGNLWRSDPQHDL